MKEFKIKYSSIAIPPENISATTVYVLEKDSDGYFIVSNREKVYMTLGMFKMLFTPIDDNKWTDLEAGKVIKQSTKAIQKSK